MCFEVCSFLLSGTELYKLLYLLVPFVTCCLRTYSSLCSILKNNTKYDKWKLKSQGGYEVSSLKQKKCD